MKGRLRSVKINDTILQNYNYNPSLLFFEKKENQNSISINSNLYDELVIEICSGTGDFLIEYAKKYPNIYFIGVDYAPKAIYRGMKKANKYELSNISFSTDNAFDFIQTLPENSCSKIYISFPDPWPKKRNHKRRIIQPAFLEFLYYLLIPKGNLNIITDNNSYIEHIEKTISNKKTHFEPYFQNNSYAITDENLFRKYFFFSQSTYYNKAVQAKAVIYFFSLLKKSQNLLKL